MGCFACYTTKLAPEINIPTLNNVAWLITSYWYRKHVWASTFILSFLFVQVLSHRAGPRYGWMCTQHGFIHLSFQWHGRRMRTRAEKHISLVVYIHPILIFTCAFFVLWVWTCYSNTILFYPKRFPLVHFCDKFYLAVTAFIYFC